MSIAIYLIAFIPTLVGPSARGVSQPKPTTVYFYEDTVQKRWCALNNVAQWKATIEGQHVLSYGKLFYSGSKLSGMQVVADDEAGDWAVYDDYEFDQNLRLTKLSRRTNVLPGDRSVVAVYSIGNGKVQRTATTTTQLSNGKLVVAADSIWMPDVPIETDAGAFPFVDLLRRPSGLTTGLSCVAAH